MSNVCKSFFSSMLFGFFQITIKSERFLPIISECFVKPEFCDRAIIKNMNCFHFRILKNSEISSILLNLNNTFLFHTAIPVKIGIQYTSISRQLNKHSSKMYASHKLTPSKENKYFISHIRDYGLDVPLNIERR